MKFRYALAVVVLLLIGTASHLYADTNNLNIVYASKERGAQILAEKDDYLMAMSPMDRALRMHSNVEVSIDDFTKFVSQFSLDWKPAEKEILDSIFTELRPKFMDLKLHFPDTVFMVKTTGEDEGYSAYTRMNAIFIPDRYFGGAGTEEISHTVTHELFHILTRNNPEYVDDLYAVINFHKCNEIEFPESLKDKRGTNPDAPYNNHYVRLDNEGDSIDVVPILYFDCELKDVSKDGFFLMFLKSGLMQIEKEKGEYHPKYVDDKPVIYEFLELFSYFDAIGDNTGYIIHPEEILAENFVLVVDGNYGVSNPEIVEQLKAAMWK